MSLFSGILQSQAPAKQDATSTIQTLTTRLSTATLIEDRRAAVQGLRSFARDYRETVASNSLRPLLTALGNDAADEESVKFILETLLLLFVRGEEAVSLLQELGRGTGTEVDGPGSKRAETTTFRCGLQMNSLRYL